MKVRLNANGIFAINGASLYERQQVTDDEQTVEPMETDANADVNNFTPNGPGGDDAPAGGQDEVSFLFLFFLVLRFKVVLFLF